MHVDVEGEDSRVVLGLDTGEDVAHVTAPREAGEPAAGVEQGIEVVDRQAGAARQVHERRRVDVSGACAHDQAFERREAHRGLHRPAAVDRGHRRAVAEVEHQLTELGDVAAEERGGRLAHVLVARAVEAVASHPMLRGERGVDRIGVGGGRERLVEGGVEHRDVRHLVEHRPRGTDTGEVRGVVQRREHRELVDLTFHVGVDEGRSVEARTTVDDAMPDRDGAVVVERGAVSGELLSHHLERLSVVGDRPLAAEGGIEHRRHGIAVDDGAHGVGDRAGLLTDALDQSAREEVLLLDVDQAVPQ